MDGIDIGLAEHRAAADQRIGRRHRCQGSNAGQRTGAVERHFKQLEAGDLSLERSIELFERGVNLSDACRKQLEDAETRVEMLIRKEGKIVAEPFRPEK